MNKIRTIIQHLFFSGQKRQIVGCLCLLSFSVIAQTHSQIQQQYAQAYTVFSQGNFNSLPNIFVNASKYKQLRPEALFNLGMLYYFGLGVERDLGTAVHFVRHAAVLDYPYAKQVMAQWHFQGNEVFQPNAQAARFWWEKALDQKQADAALSLGTQVFLGKEYPRDILLTLVLFNESGVSNHPLASAYKGWLQEQLYDVREKDASWIRQQKPIEYTIEFFLGFNEINARTYIELTKLQNAKLYRNKEGNWVVIAGKYSSKLLVNNALDKLSTLFEKNPPRKRAFFQVQADILPENPILAPDWVLKRSPSQYSVQLKISASESVAKDFVVFNGLQNAAIFRDLNGQFRVIAGAFNDKQRANSAYQGLPRNLISKDTMIFSFADLQSVFAEQSQRVKLPYVSPIGLRFTHGFNNKQRFIDIPNNEKIKTHANLSVVFRDVPIKRISAIDYSKSLNSDYALPQKIFFFDDIWLSQRNAAEYTVELFRAKTRQQILDFAVYFGLESGFIYQIGSDFALGSGIFTDKALASKAIKSLPKVFASLQPKALAFGEIQTMKSLINPAFAKAPSKNIKIVKMQTKPKNNVRTKAKTKSNHKNQKSGWRFF